MINEHFLDALTYAIDTSGHTIGKLGRTVKVDKLKISDRYDTTVEVVDQDTNTRRNVKTTISAFNNDIMPDKIIFNKDNTILVKDDDRYVIKCSDDDIFDPVFGFLYGYFLMNNGMSKTQAAKFFRQIEDVVFSFDDDDKDKESEIKDIISNKHLTLDEYEKRMRKVLEEYIV